MGGLIINGQRVPLRNANIKVEDFLENPSLRLDSSDCTQRTAKWVRQLFVHTTEGIPTKVVDKRPGIRAGKFWRDAWANGRTPTGAPDHAGAGIVIDWDGSAACLEDLGSVAAYHAGAMNQTSIGIELHQGRDGTITIAQLETLADIAVTLVKFQAIDNGPKVCIAPVVHSGPYMNVPLQRMQTQEGRANCCGIFGHRDATDQRGIGDAGDDWRGFVINADKSIVSCDFSKNEDIEFWKKWQTNYNLTATNKLSVDGVAGPATLKAYYNR